MSEALGSYLMQLKNRINLHNIPFSDRGSRLLVFQQDHKLLIRLAERWFKSEGQLSAYRQRPPLIHEWQFLDGDGGSLDFEMETYPHCIHFHTRVGTFTLSFLDSETLIVRLPSNRCGMAFHANLDQAQADRRGGCLHLTGNIRRNIAYTTNAKIIVNTVAASNEGDQQILLLLDAGAGSSANGCNAVLLNITPRLGYTRYIPDPDMAIDEAARRWHAWFAAAPPVETKYQQQYYYAWWVMRAGLISTRFYTTREAMTPSKNYYVGVWQWDAYFHALAYRYIETRLAQDQLRLLLDHQRDDGMIPDAVHDEGVVTHLTFPIDADVTKPPLLAWAAWKLYEHTPDREFLEEIYEPVVRWNQWWFEKNDLNGDGLCEYQHPFSSGLDDSPLWDLGMPVEAPDLNTYLCLQQEALGKIAGVIGLQKEAHMWQERAEELEGRILDKMWDADSGLFWARKDGVPVPVRTPFSLFPLLTGRLPRSVAERLVSHLTDPHQFWPRYPVPTVALNDPKYNPEQMWRGPSWMNVNYLLIEGLSRSGYARLAGELRRRTLELIASQDDIYEYYNPETGANPPGAASIFGWSSAVFIDLAIQESMEA
jgi:hypothetical protein